MYKVFATTLFALILSGCGHYDHYYYDPVAALNEAQGAARTVINPGNIPAPFKGCVGTHDMNGQVGATGHSASWYVGEYDTRDCPPAQLN